MTLAALFFAPLFPNGANAEDPVLLSIYAPGGLYYQAQLVGDIVYMAGFENFHVVDVSDPTQPSQLAIHGVTASVGLEVVGDRVYLAQLSAPNLQVLSVANPAAPVSIGDWSLPVIGSGSNLEVVGNTVYLSAGADGLRILDVSALPTIVELGTFDPPEMLQSVAVSGSHAYVAAGAAGLFIVDISDPTMPDHVGTIADSAVGSVEVVGTHLYVGGDEFCIFDVSSSGSPVLLGQAAIEAGLLRVDEAAGLAYAGSFVIDVSDVAQPVLVATISIPFPPLPGNLIVGSDGIDGVVYVPHSALGLHAFRISLPSQALPALGGLAALPLALLGWRALRARRRKRRSSAM